MKRREEPLQPLFHLLKALALAFLLVAAFTVDSWAPSTDPSSHAASGRASTGLGSARTKGGERLLQFTSAGHVLGFATDGVMVASASHMLRIGFVHARAVAPEADDAVSVEGSVNGAPALRRVTYRNVWDGVTAVYEAGAGAIVKSTYQVAATEHGIPVDRIRLGYNRPVSLDEKGNLVIRYDHGTMVEAAPIAWQETEGGRKPVPVAYALYGQSEVGFSLGEHLPGIPVVIDPALTWNTFLGGSGSDDAYGIAVDGSGNVYVAGSSMATWGAPVRAYTSQMDAFAAKLDSSGALQWNTFLGGSGWDYGYGIAVDGGGNVYVAGYSTAAWGAPVRAYTASVDAFAAKLNSSGTLQWNTFLGGSNADYGYAIAVDGGGNVYVGGASGDTWGTPVRAFTSGGMDAFAAKLNSSGTLTWNTFLGGSGGEYGNAIAVDGSGNIYVAGDSGATWGSPVRAFTSGVMDGFAAKLSSSGNLTWNTFLGGSGEDFGRAVAVDGSGNVYVGGYGNAAWGSPVRAYTAANDVYAAKLDSSGTLQWHTFLGGSNTDYGHAIAVDGGGNVYVGGASGDTWGTPVRAFTSGGMDAFAAKLNSSGTLTWNTFLGGSGGEYGNAIAVGGSGNVYVAGYSTATWGSPVRDYTASFDAFVASLMADPTKLAITSVNGGANPTAGTGFSVIVQAQNSSSVASPVIADTAVILSLKTGTGTLGGTLTGTITNGTSSVTFASVTYSKAESGVVLTATRTSGDVLTPGDSSAFTVDPIWGDTDWAYRKPLTIPGTNIWGSLTNFPVLVSLADPDLASHAQTNGYDLVFTAADGITKLSHEIESFVGPDGTLEAWVKLPTLTTNVDTTLFLYYGNASTTNQQNAAAVWDSSYKAVWHLNEASGTRNDSTGNTNHLASQNGVASTTGKAGLAAVFDTGTADQLLRIGDATQTGLDITGPLTLQGWFNTDLIGTTQAIASKDGSSPQHAYHLRYSSSQRLTSELSADGTAQTTLNGTTTTLTTNRWYHAVAVYDGTNVTLYLNGVGDGSTPHAGGLLNSTADFNIGGRNSNANEFDGRIDEVRVSNVARSADWIATEYYNQNNPAAFLSAGTQEACPPPTAVGLVAFTVQPLAPDLVDLSWSTASETDNAGFHLYGAPAPDGPYTRLNPRLIPAQGTPSAGASYSLQLAVPAGTLCYALEDVDLHGQVTIRARVFFRPSIPLRLTRGLAGALTLDFTPEPGWDYTLFYRDDLEPGTRWQPLPQTPPGPGRLTDLTAAGIRQRFYTVVGIRTLLR